MYFQKLFKFILLFIFFLQTSQKIINNRLLTLDLTYVNTTQTKTSNTQYYCSSDKNSLVSDTARSSNTAYLSQMNQYISNNQQNAIVVAALNLNTDNINSYVTNPTKQIIIYNIPFLIGAAIAIFVSILVLPCCLFPRKCPPRFLRKKRNQQYTQNQLKWPVIGGVIIMIGIIIISIIGFVWLDNFSTNIKSFSCGISTVMNEIINGGIKNDQSTFFSGTYTLYNSVSQFQNYVNQTLINLSQNLQAPIDNSTSYLNNAVSQLVTMGDGSSSNSSFSLTYNLASILTLYNTTAINTTIDSKLKLDFGNPTINPSISYSLYTALLNIYPIINQLVNYQNILNNTINQLTVLQNLQDTYYSYYLTAKATDQSLQQTFTQIDSAISLTKSLLLVFFIFLLIFAILGLSGLVIVNITKKIKFRFMIYTACTFIFFLSLIGFLLCFFLLTLNTILYYGCNNVNQNLGNSTKFQNLINSYGYNSSYVSLLSKCINTDGNIINNLNTNFTTADIQTVSNYILNNATYMLNNISTLNITALKQTVQNVSQTIKSYLNGSKNDIIYNQSVFTWFSGLANQNLYSTSCANDPKFALYSIVPYINSNDSPKINCSSGISNGTCIKTINTCSSGCISLQSVMENQTDSTSFTSNINLLFTDATCQAQLTPDLVNLYTNWYIVKMNSTIGIQSLYNRYKSDFSQNVGLVVGTINNVTNLKTTISDLIKNANTFMDATYGVIAATNCKTIGQDIVTTKDVICVNIFNNIYEIVIILGIGSFLCVLSIIFFGCTTYRHYSIFLKQIDKLFYKQAPKEYQKTMVPQKTYTQENLK